MATQAPPQTTKAAAIPALAAAPVNLLQRKCACSGNPGPSGECEGCRKKRLTGEGLRIQAKLVVNQPGDRWEKEADRVAEAVISKSGFDPVASQPVGPLAMRQVDSTTLDSDMPSLVSETIRSNGASLDSETRSFMEKRFGYDFSRVRVHTDQLAADSAREINALAYTVGQDVVFSAGQYAPYSLAGQKLLAHELTHVVQQSADHQAAPVHRSTAGLIQRQTIDTATCDTDQADRFREAHGTAIQWVEYARERLDEPQSVRNLLNTHFGLQPTDPSVATVRNTYGQILNALQGSTNTYRCEPDATCRTEIGRDTNNNPIYRGGYAGANTITFCAYMFDTGGENFTRLLVHETAHTNPANLPDGPYRRQSGYPGPTPLTNAEAYSEFLRDLEHFRVGIVLALTGGFAAPSRGAATWQARLFYGVEFEHPVLGVFNPVLGLGFGLIGETTIPGEPPITSGPTILASLLAGIRITSPRDDGTGGYVSLFGGPAVATSLGSGGVGIGAEAGLGVGYRWRVLDLSAGIGYTYDPTREAGMEHLATGSVGLSIPIDRILE